MEKYPHGKNRKLISTTISSDAYQKLVSLAEKSDISVARYCRAIIEDAVKKNLLVRVEVGENK